MSAVKMHGKLGYIMSSAILFLCLYPRASSVSLKTFNYRWIDGTFRQVSYPRTKHGDCVYDATRDLVTCVKNHPYDTITSTWRYKAENVSYVAVNCRAQRIYTGHYSECVCKDRTMAAHPHKQTQRDSYVFCQLDAIYPDMLQPLTNLEVLDLAHNHLFRVPPHCFDDMAKMKLLSLSNNQIEHFFDGLLCHVPSLEVLLLQDLPLTSFPANLFQCASDFRSSLKVIDISHSKLSTFKEGDFQSLNHLGLLDISYNKLETLPEEPFLGLSSLQTLDISGNRFTQMPRSLCVGLEQVQKLFINHNLLQTFNCSIFETCINLTYLFVSEGLVANITGSPCRLDSLKHLDISGNKLSQMPLKLIHNDSVLEYIDLSNNRLEGVDTETFHDMTRLKCLNVSYNQIDKIDETFQKASLHLQNLEVLDFTKNQIHQLYDNSFMSLSTLKELYLTDNYIKQVRAESFKGLGDVSKLYLRSNNIGRIEKESFSHMEKLTVLDLSQNQLVHLDTEYPSSLRKLDLSHNQIRTMESIGDLYNLQELYLQGNAISYIASDWFINMTNLQIIDMSKNSLSTISDGLFSTLPKLEEVHLRGNGLTIDFGKDLFHDSKLMRRLDLSGNKIRNIDNLLDGVSMTHVEHLDLSFNNISAIRRPLNKRNESVSLKWLNLESCGIEFVVRDAFVNMGVLEYVKLLNNSITFVPLFDARLGAMFFFRGNPIICTCGMVWLEERWLDTDTVEKMSTYDYDVDVCRTYPSMIVKPIRNLSDREFMCPVPSNCPTECDCFVLKEGGSVYMTVCRNNLTNIPQNLPHDSEYLYLDGNNFHTVQRISKGFHYTENIFLNNSGVVSFGEVVFKDFSHVFVIDISCNDLKSLPTSIFQGLKYLKDINLQHNHLTHLSKGLLKNVPALQNIDISYNNIHHILPETLQDLDHLDTFRWIKMAGNPLLCSCPNQEFRLWMERRYNRVYDRRNVLCEGEEIRRVDMDRFECEDDFPDGLKTAVIVACVVSVVVPLIVLLVYCRKEVSAVCYTRFAPICYTGTGSGHHHTDPCIYDAVVLYDTSDPKCLWWIQKSLVPKLTEGRRKFKLYILKHDILSRETAMFYIQKSHCTIAIVNNTFPQNRFALECFRHSAAHDVGNNGNHRMIMVTWGFIDKKNLPQCLRHYVERDRILPVTSTCFWDKLIQKLPDTRHRLQGLDNQGYDMEENTL
ncbi:toll-like receptor Tollo [Haliotis asinina]|uniref:toll-like receptor Tollo n=1 Tax=Haliotis asinina TaxID=109174 RepID=UPI0035318C9B